MHSENNSLLLRITDLINNELRIRSETETRGRARGGICQFIRKDLKADMVPLVTNSFRTQAYKLLINGRSILWVNAYFPTDTNDNIEELNELLISISELIDITDTSDVIIGGDLNVDLGRSSKATDCVTTWLLDNELTSIWSTVDIDYTHHNLNWNGTSKIYHFLLSSSLLPLVTSARVQHLHREFSRHDPILLSIDLGKLTFDNSTCHVNTRRPNWNKSTYEDILNYNHKLDSLLSDLKTTPGLSCNDCTCNCPDHRNDIDNFILDVITGINEALFTTLPLSGKTPSQSSLNRRTVRNCKRELLNLTRMNLYTGTRRSRNVSVMLRRTRLSRCCLLDCFQISV